MPRLIEVEEEEEEEGEDGTVEVVVVEFGSGLIESSCSAVTTSMLRIGARERWSRDGGWKRALERVAGRPRRGVCWPELGSSDLISWGSSGSSGLLRLLLPSSLFPCPVPPPTSCVSMLQMSWAMLPAVKTESEVALEASDPLDALSVPREDGEVDSVEESCAGAAASSGLVCFRGLPLFRFAGRSCVESNEVGAVSGEKLYTSGLSVSSSTEGFTDC